MIFALAIFIMLAFGYSAFFGAPYVPTLQKHVEDALDLLDLQPGEHLLELGSGDGRLLLAAARRGIHATGYELNPLLVAYSRIKLWRYRSTTSVKLQNYWVQKLPPCDGIYVFLLDKYMEKLDAKITAERTRPVKLVSFAFKVPGKKPLRERRGMRLYTY